MIRLGTSARWVRAALAASAGLCVSALGLPAQARSGGIAGVSCQGCHGSNGSGQLTLAASPQSFGPGARVELTLSIIGGFAVGGAYVATGGVGDLQSIANQGLTEVSTGLVHNQPKTASGGSVQFRFAWVAPTSPGAVRFSVSALGADGNGRSSGDTGLDGNFDFVFGCTAQTFYLDGDGDGFGRDDVQLVACADKPPQSYVAMAGDCDDFRESAHPGAQEVCNTIDDNCDGKVDENAVPVELWPDADGDGYYDVRTEKAGEPKIGCAGMAGWAAMAGDCKPNDKSVHAGAEEVCNGIDDDCDGDVDERVRPTCGEGWCRRAAPGCDAQYCVPGQPEKEKCNFLDDDCDGLTDEDPDLCPVGQVCAAGSCVDSSTVIVDPTPNPGMAGTGVAGSSSSAGSATGGSGVVDATGSASCALGTRTGHGSLAVLAALFAARAVRLRLSARRR